MTPSVLPSLLSARPHIDSRTDTAVIKGISNRIVDFLTARGVIEFLNNEHDLASMLENLPIDTSVSIGYENSRTELAQSSVVSTRYAVDGKPSGVLAVVGPVRMDYGRVISILESVADTVGTLIGELTDIDFY